MNYKVCFSEKTGKYYCAKKKRSEYDCVIANWRSLKEGKSLALFLTKEGSDY